MGNHGLRKIIPPLVLLAKYFVILLHFQRRKWYKFVKLGKREGGEKINNTKYI